MAQEGSDQTNQVHSVLPLQHASCHAPCCEHATFHRQTASEVSAWITLHTLGSTLNDPAAQYAAIISPDLQS